MLKIIEKLCEKENNGPKEVVVEKTGSKIKVTYREKLMSLTENCHFLGKVT